MVTNLSFLSLIVSSLILWFFFVIGYLAKPVTKGNWYTETPGHLFSHKSMEIEAQLVDAFQEDNWATGMFSHSNIRFAKSPVLIHLRISTQVLVDVC